jgi:hypothetical protein
MTAEQSRSALTAKLSRAGSQHPLLAAQPLPRAPRLPLEMAKIVEQRRRSRIDRVRQMAYNVELQKSILHTTELYNMEAERQRLSTALRPDVNYVPALARPMHQAQLEAMTRSIERRGAELQPGPFMEPLRQPRARRLRLVGEGQQTLDVFARGV